MPTRNAVGGTVTIYKILKTLCLNPLIATLGNLLFSVVFYSFADALLMLINIQMYKNKYFFEFIFVNLACI